LPERVFIVFGSLSDRDTFEPVIEEFKARRVPYVFHGLSAHKTPNELFAELKKTSALIFIAGAGLAAALPGVVASQTIKPVIGIATNKDFEGLDSLLSTLQMPPGIPVLTVGPKNSIGAAKDTINFLNRFSGITLVDRKEKNAKEVFKKACKMLKEFRVFYNTTIKTDYSRKTELYIDFVSIDELKELSDTPATVIVVPVKKESKARDAVTILESMQNHLWVGLNRYDNAVIGAMQLMSLGSTFEKRLLLFRQKIPPDFTKWLRNLNIGFNNLEKII